MTNMDTDETAVGTETALPLLTSAPGVAISANAEVGSDAWASAFLIRKFEERLLSLFSEGRLAGTVHTSIGQELGAVAVARCLRPGDYVFSNHRCHGHYLARTSNTDGLMAEIMGRRSGICGGRGGSQHICDRGFFSNGIQGGIVPVSVGLALAQKLRGTEDIALVWIGDGTLGEGVVYESFNLAARWELPLAVVLENNLYAQSTKQTETLAGDIDLRATAFGIRAMHASVWNPAGLFDRAEEAVDYVRQTSRPVFLRVDSYRLMAHSKGDDERDPDEVKRYWSLDPLRRFSETFPDLADKLEAEAEGAITAAVKRASDSPFAAPTMYNAAADSETIWTRTNIEVNRRGVSCIHSALRSNMERDTRIFCLGEDVEDPYGGAFKVTGNLSRLFPGRVRNTPISEAAIVGMANGMAMAGYRPVVEVMFGDFLTLAADQIINHAAKFRYIYNDQVTVPLIVRVPVGGKRGYGATHSQCLEKHFLGIPDTRVLALHHRYDPELIYNRLFATVDRPTLVLEHKLVYGMYVSSQAPEGFVWEHTNDDFPVSRLRPRAAPDITILCYGGMLAEAEVAANNLFEQHEIVAEVLCPTELYPLRMGPVLSSTNVSKRLLVVEEGQLFSGFGAEVMASLHELAPGRLPKAKRLGAAVSALPASKPAELKMLPSAESITEAAVEIVYD